MPSERGWAFCSAGLCALSYRFAVRSDDELLGRQVDALFAGLRLAAGTQGPATDTVVDHWYSLTVAARTGTVDVRRDDEPLALGQRTGDALGWIVWDVNRSAAAASGQHLLLHAGALNAYGTGILLPGTSGSGKSTLTAGLAHAGLGYLTDELVALDLISGDLMPYAKPITLKRGSFAVLPDLDPGVTVGVGPGGWTGAEWQVPVGGVTGLRIGAACAPGLVVLPRYDPEAPTRLTALSDTEAFLSLALHAVNLVPHGAAGSAALGRLVAQSSCYALTMSSLDDARSVLLELTDAGVPALYGAERGD